MNEKLSQHVNLFNTSGAEAPEGSIWLGHVSLTYPLMSAFWLVRPVHLHLGWLLTYEGVLLPSFHLSSECSVSPLFLFPCVSVCFVVWCFSWCFSLFTLCLCHVSCLCSRFLVFCLPWNLYKSCHTWEFFLFIVSYLYLPIHVLSFCFLSFRVSVDSDNFFYCGFFTRLKQI